MPDSLLTEAQKSKISKAIERRNYRQVIAVLEAVKTAHAGTAKTKDKRFVLKEIISLIKDKNKQKTEKLLMKDFFNAGIKFCKMKPDVSRQIGISLIWRAYKYNKEKVKQILLQTADHPNWEVRESAGGAFANTLYYNNDFYTTLKKWRKHKFPNVKRAVVIGALGLRETGNPRCAQKAFKLLEPLLYDSSAYIKKNLGPFVLGSYYGSSHPKELFKQLDKWLKIKDEHARWNVAMTFNNSFGNKYPREALKYLRILAKDKSPVVQRAVKSTLNHLRKRHKNISL
jgi:hypothetical protein